MAGVGIRSIVEKWTVFCLFYFTDHTSSISQLHVELVCLRYLHGKVKCFAKILKIAKNKCKSRPSERTTEQNVPVGTPLYKLYRYVPSHQVARVFAPFWSENGYTLCPVWSGIWYSFRGNYGIVWTYLSFQFQMSKKERKYVNSKWIWRIFLFAL